jgi:enoyl-CoA hydratase
MTLVHVEHRDGTVVIELARPPVNALNLELLGQLHRTLDELAARPPAGGLVLTGRGPLFSAGVDFKELPGYSRAQRAEMIGHINGAVACLYGLETATVAAVNGHAIGGAFVLMLACDVRLLTTGETKLGLTEVTAGIPYPACPIEIVKAEIEPALRRRLVLSGELIAPELLLTRGIVDVLVEPDDLVGRALTLARQRAAAASYGPVKRQLRGETIARLQEIVSGARDPMLESWT